MPTELQKLTSPQGEPYLVFGAPTIGEAEIEEVADSLRSGWLGSGPKVARFEERMREYTGAQHAIALHSCTAALHLSLLAAGLRDGDEVITTPMTFCATVAAILHAGARPILVDCDRRTQLIDPQRIEDAITPRTRAIIPVHLTGRICAMDDILDIARTRDLLVIEDAAHALEGEYRGRKVGNIGHLTCFSFYVTKNITTGEGGVVTTNDPDIAGRIKTYALHGLTRDAWQRYSDAGYRHYQVVYPGFKYNMMDLQAAIGLHQLPHVEEWHRARTRIWTRYDEAFADLPVEIPEAEEPATLHARHLYTLMIDPARAGITRDELMARLHRLGIGTGVHYVGVHLQPYYRDHWGCSPADFPNATWISERTISLPISPSYDDATVDRVIRSVRTVLTGGGR